MDWPRKSEMKVERAVGWPALAPVLICFVKRVVIGSQIAGLPPGWGTGMTRSCCQSSDQGAENGGLGDFLAEVSYEIVGGFGAVLDEQGVGVGGERRDLAGAGGGGWLLPGLIATQGEDEGKAAAETTKSGDSAVVAGRPSRLRGTAEPSATSRASRVRAIAEAV